MVKTINASNSYQQEQNQELENAQSVKDSPVLIDRAPRKLNSTPIKHELTDIDSQIANATTRTELEQQFALMSVFSRMAYHRHIPEKLRYGHDDTTETNLHPKTEACIKNTQNNTTDKNRPYKHPIHWLYENSPEDETKSRWILWNEPSDTGCVSEGGLFYETYVYKQLNGTQDETKPQIAVIAFRGTENSSNQLFLDWWGNLSNAFGFEPSEYKLAKKKLKNTVQGLLGQNSSIKIYVTGHSLGGGLAQQAAYLHKEILAAYVFNTSPVTNWSNNQLEKNDQGKSFLIQNTDPRIYRIELRGEFLNYVRWLTTRVSDRRFGRSDYVFQYQSGSPIARHHMSILACYFLSSIKEKNVAQFNLTHAMASRLLKDNSKSEVDRKNPLGATESFCPSDIYQP